MGNLEEVIRNRKFKGEGDPIVRAFIIQTTDRVTRELLGDLLPKIEERVAEELHRLTTTIKKGDQGEKGEKGERGEKGETGARGERGSAGKDGVNGTDGRDGANGKDGKNGKDGSPDSAELMAEKLNAFPGSVGMHVVKGLEIYLKNLNRSIKEKKGMGGQAVGSGDSVSAGANITITRVNGRKVITASGGAGATFFIETPTGAVDGANKSYTVSTTITTILNFSINGVFIHPADYTFNGTTITFITALDASLTGLPFTIVYA